MRLLDKGKEPARFPRDIRHSPPQKPRINYPWNYHASNTFRTRSAKARYMLLLWFFEEALRRCSWGPSPFPRSIPRSCP